MGGGVLTSSSSGVADADLWTADLLSLNSAAGLSGPSWLMAVITGADLDGVSLNGASLSWSSWSFSLSRSSTAASDNDNIDHNNLLHSNQSWR